MLEQIQSGDSDKGKINVKFHMPKLPLAIFGLYAFLPHPLTKWIGNAHSWNCNGSSRQSALYHVSISLSGVPSAYSNHRE